MRPLSCWLGQHDYLRRYTPGWFRLRCTKCGHETPGIRGPIGHVEPPVVTTKKAKATPKARLAVVPAKARRTA